jgi:hypothetical protein
MSWFSRSFFVIVAVLAAGSLWSAQGCTRRGGSGTTPPTTTPQSTFYVNPVSGSDTTGNGTQATPYKTITKALAVVAKSSATNLTISLAAGTYSTASGETFPLIVPTSVSIAGTLQSARKTSGISYLSGYGEDKALETALNSAPATYYSTLVVPAAVTGVSLQNVYVGAANVTLASRQHYQSLDALGTVDAMHVSFGTSKTPHSVDGGIIVPSGNLTCTACVVSGNLFAIEAFTAPTASSAPTLTLSGQISQSLIGGTLTGILTDGTATISAADQTFETTNYAYRDTLTPPTYPPTSPSPSPSASPTTYPSYSPYPTAKIDFGSPGGSAGGNLFNATKTTEIDVTQPGQTIQAYGNTWNRTQGADTRNGLYLRPQTFHTGDHGLNVTITGASSVVMVGPIVTTPTPSPTPYPSTSPTTSPT